MAYCFLTGLEIELQESLVLNRYKVMNTIREFEAKTKALRRLFDQLAEVDAVQIHRQGEVFEQRQRRLVSKAIAEAFQADFDGVELFETWPDYRANRLQQTLMRMQRYPALRDYVHDLGVELLSDAIYLANQLLRDVNSVSRLSSPEYDYFVGAVCTTYLKEHPEGDEEGLRSFLNDADYLDHLGFNEKHLHAVQQRIRHSEASDD